MQRNTARKVRNRDLVEGEFVKTEGSMEPNYVVTPLNEMVSRARVMGVVVSRFVSEDESYINVTIDDTTETLALRAFRETEALKDVEVGQTIDVVGKAKEYQGEIYILVEGVSVLEDPNWELVRRLELAEKDKNLGRKPRQPPQGEKEGEEARGKEEVKELIESKDEGEGVKYITIARGVGIGEDHLDDIINELLVEGEIYEPKIGRFKIMNE